MCDTNARDDAEHRMWEVLRCVLQLWGKTCGVGTNESTYQSKGYTASNGQIITNTVSRTVYQGMFVELEEFPDSFLRPFEDKC